MGKIIKIDPDLIVTDEHREFYTKLGATIRKTRTERGISVEALAAAAQITPEQLTAYENAELAVPIYTMMPIMQFMNYPPEFDKLGQ